MSVLEAMIRNHTALARRFKKEENTPMNRYHHGFAEGLKIAKRVLEAENGND